MEHSQTFSAADLWLFFSVVIFPSWPNYLIYLPTYLPINLPSLLPTYLPTYIPAYLPIYLHAFLSTHPPSYLTLTQCQHLTMDITTWKYCNKFIHNHFSNIWSLTMIKCYRTLMKLLHGALWPWFYKCASTLGYLMHDPPNLVYLIYLSIGL